MKKLIRLTEGDLRRIVENSVRRTLNEISYDTVANAYGKASNAVMDKNNPKYQQRLRQSAAFSNALNKKTDLEFPDTQARSEINNQDPLNNPKKWSEKAKGYYKRGYRSPNEWINKYGNSNE